MMKPLLDRGADWLRRRLPDVAAQTVEIRTPHGVLESIRAVPGSQDFEEYAVDEHVGTTYRFDWIVAEQELFFGGRKREPESGWEIRWIRADGRTAVYKAQPITGSRPFDVVDNLGLMYRIHTKLTEITDA